MSDYFWESADIRLRPMQKEDAERFLSADEESVSKRTLNCTIGLPRSLGIQLDQLSVDFKNAPQRLDFSVETLKSEFVGIVAIDEINEQSGTFSTVSFIFSGYRGRGYLTQAKQLMLRYMFYERRFQKYNTSCIETNEAIIHHLLKIGCKEEGKRRRNIYTDGQYFDELLFGMTQQLPYLTFLRKMWFIFPNL